MGVIIIIGLTFCAVLGYICYRVAKEIDDFEL